ncbi:MAG: RNA methyltransferase [Sulfuriferula sp.]|nr:RNA methyltransferase [Sulfuriferula sp.]
MITSAHNSQYKALKKLADNSSERRELGLTLLDGEHLLLAYLATGGTPKLVITTESSAQHPLLTQLADVPHLLLAPSLFNTLSPVKTPTGLMLLIDIPQPVETHAPQFILLLEAIQDPGNLGTMLRSAAAAGVDSVYLSTGCADAWSPKVLRGGMGAHFATQIIEHADLIQVAQQFNGLICATALDAPHSLFQTKLTGKVGFAIGNEGAGLSPPLRAATTCAISIPMPGQVESLNAAAALAICLFERVRQLA